MEGSLSINGTVGFAAQVPWVFHGNIEDNIRFNRPLNKDKLTECIDNCYLTRVSLEFGFRGPYYLLKFLITSSDSIILIFMAHEETV